ncbi:Colicin V production protein [Rubripirellula amarantea]|uniref:Colicin V production protein n=1 Tax=Rubripirellula amarantea TaxID=2527999 RepID=A0A5C5WSS1_9BACT|nr:CvpA family protein [Rubripirellula amarantea]TWT53123.1 Colicin V production protein [Rubripirellula amarantea]
MEIYDILMIVVLVAAMVFGAIKGFAWQLASIASIVVSYFVAMRFSEPFSHSIALESPWNRFLAMLILYVVTSLLVWVAFRMISHSIDRMKLSEFDHHIGAVFGLIKGGLYCILITLFAVTLGGTWARETVVRSKGGHYIADLLDRSESVIPPEIHQIVDPYLQRFDQQFNQPTGSGTLSPNAAQVASELIAPGGSWSPESAWQNPPTANPTTQPNNQWDSVPRQARQFDGNIQR